MHNTPWAVALSIGAAALLGLGAVVARIGVRYASARTGASISVPITTLCFWLLSPAFLRLEGASVGAAVLFGAVGLFFPASVTLLNFESARRIGPSIASAIGTSSVLFSAIIAMVWLHERPSLAMLGGSVVIVLGLALITIRNTDRGIAFSRVWLWMPLVGAVIRATAQTTIKYALAIWPSPFAASLLSYTVSASLLVATRPPSPELVRGQGGRAVVWFAFAGLCNGGAVLATYSALQAGPVTLVIPLATTAPLFAVLASAVFLREEHFDRQLLAGVVITVLGAVLLVSRP